MSLHNLHDYPAFNPDDQVIPGGIPGWCRLNGFSLETGRRVIARGEIGVVQLSLRRRGITFGENKRWRAARTVKAG